MAAVAAEHIDAAAAQRLGREVTIPVVSISQADGGQLAVAIEAGRTTVSLSGVLQFVLQLLFTIVSIAHPI